MKEETKRVCAEVIAMIVIILLAFLFGGAIYFMATGLGKTLDSQSQADSHSKVESDLCYSLKVNRMWIEDVKENYGDIDGVEKFENALTIMENRNWMGCKQ